MPIIGIKNLSSKVNKLIMQLKILFQLLALASVCLVVLAGSYGGRYSISSLGEDKRAGCQTRNYVQSLRSVNGRRFRWQDEIDERSDEEKPYEEKPDEERSHDDKLDEKPRMLDEVLGLAGLPKDCGQFLGLRRGFINRTSNVRVIGGSTAYANSYPSFAYLPAKKGTRGFCGGTIIHKRYILTAAHCFRFHDGTSKFKQVGLGSVKTMDNLMDPERVCISSYYTGSFKDDFALLRLPRDIIFDRFTQPACLPDTEPDSEEMDRLTTIGMGLMEDDEVSYELQMYESKWRNCERYTMPEIVCYADRKSQGGRTCKGDSGSGTFFERNGRQYLLAVLSGSNNVKCHKKDNNAFSIGGDVFQQRSTIDRMLKECGGTASVDRAKLRSLGFIDDPRIVFV